MESMDCISYVDCEHNLIIADFLKDCVLLDDNEPQLVCDENLGMQLGSSNSSVTPSTLQHSSNSSRMPLATLHNNHQQQRNVQPSPSESIFRQKQLFKPKSSNVSVGTSQPAVKKLKLRHSWSQ